MYSNKKEIERLAQTWRNSGIDEGDTILIHSSIKRTLQDITKKGTPFNADDLLQSFIEAVGINGTLVFPLFNFNFKEEKFFDINKTVSNMGLLTETARLHPKSERTGHPMYSFCAIGKESNKFKIIDNKSAYGKDSPFALLLKLNGKIAVLDLEENESMTVYHHVEEMHDINYRYHKNFTGEYINREGILSKRTYSIFVRDLDKNIKTNVNPGGELLWKIGLYKGDRPFVNSGLRTIDANKLYDFISNIIIDGEALGKLYEIGN